MADEEEYDDFDDGEERDQQHHHFLFSNNPSGLLVNLKCRLTFELLTNQHSDILILFFLFLI